MLSGAAARSSPELPNCNHAGICCPSINRHANNDGSFIPPVPACTVPDCTVPARTAFVKSNNPTSPSFPVAATLTITAFIPSSVNGLSNAANCSALNTVFRSGVNTRICQ